MELRHLIPGEGMSDAEIRWRQAVANSLAQPETNITTIEVGESILQSRVTYPAADFKKLIGTIFEK